MSYEVLSDETRRNYDQFGHEGVNGQGFGGAGGFGTRIWWIWWYIWGYIWDMFGGGFGGGSRQRRRGQNVVQI